MNNFNKAWKNLSNQEQTKQKVSPFHTPQSSSLTKEDKSNIHKELMKSAMAGNLTKDEGSPFAICTASVGRENKEKYESCVLEVKEKMGIKKGIGIDSKFSNDIIAYDEKKGIWFARCGADYQQVTDKSKEYCEEWLKNHQKNRHSTEKSQEMTLDEADQIAQASTEATGTEKGNHKWDSAYEEQVIDTAHDTDRPEQNNKEKANYKWDEPYETVTNLEYLIDRPEQNNKAEKGGPGSGPQEGGSKKPKEGTVEHYQQLLADPKTKFKDHFKWHDFDRNDVPTKKPKTKKDMGVANAGQVPNSLLADQDLEGTTHSTTRPGEKEQANTN